MTLRLALLIHCGVMTLALLGAVVVLRRRGLLSPLNTGTWVVLALGLYFVFNPAVSLLTNDLRVYREALDVFTREGPPRVFWILGVVLAGLASYLFFYVKGGARPRSVLLTGRWSVLEAAALAVFAVLALYSLLFYRTRGAFVDTTLSAQFNDGRIVGGVTGYTIVAQRFVLFIVVFLLIRGPSTARWFGGLLALTFFSLKLYDAYDRSSIVSMMLAIGLVSVVRSEGRLSRGKLRRKFLIATAATVVMTGFLVIRGHKSIRNMGNDTLIHGEQSLREADTAMLPVLYSWSYAYEQYGYDYGMPVVSSALFGWLPRQYFPWKDDLGKLMLGRVGIQYSGLYDEWFVGPKGSVIGAFYGHGGILGVILGMAVLGMLSRRLDTLVVSARSDLVRSLGIVWMADVWIMVGSGDVWIMNRLFVAALPFMGVWIASRLDGRKVNRRVGTLPRRHPGA